MNRFQREELKVIKLNTRDCCFLCLESVRESAGPGHRKVRKSTASFSKIEWLLKHLKIKNCSIESEREIGGEIEVNLCPSCGTINERISTLCQQLEKIQLEINHFLDRVHERMEESERNQELTQYFSRIMVNDKELSSQLQVVTKLREEVSKKTSKNMQRGSQLRIELPRTQVTPEVIFKIEREEPFNDIKVDLEDDYYSDAQGDSPSLPESFLMPIPTEYLPEDGYQSPASKASIKRIHKRAKPAIKRKRKRTKPPAFSSDEDSSNENEETEADKEFLNEISNKIVIPQLPIDKVNFSNLSDFMSSTIRLIFQNDNCSKHSARSDAVSKFKNWLNRLKKNSPKYFLAKLELEKELLHLDWDPTTEQIHLGNVPIVINEKKRRINCSKCPPYQISYPIPEATEETNLSKRIKIHVIKHLNIFQCPLSNCPDKTVYNCQEYEYHLKRHLKPKFSGFTCDICGKPFKKNQKITLEGHKWTHKNAKEREESPMHHCNICGITFRSHATMWRHHKKFHLDKSQAPTHSVDSEDEPEVKKKKENKLDAKTVEDFLQIFQNQVENFNITCNPIDKVFFSEDTPEFTKFTLTYLLRMDEGNLKGKLFGLNLFKRETSAMDKSSIHYLIKKFELEKKFQFFDYEPISQTVHFLGVPVIINEEDKSIGCSQCTYKQKLEWPQPEFQKEFKNWKYYVKSHIQKMHLSIYNCPLESCKEDFNCFEYLNHLKSHEGSAYLFECDICGRPFFQNSHMLKHRSSHQGPEEKSKEFPTFECSTCGKKCTTAQLLSSHQQIHEPNRERVLCPICGKSVIKKYFACHKARTCSVPKHECLHCGKMFKSEKEKRIHVMRVHSDNPELRPYLCEICSRSYRFEEDLRGHIRKMHK